MIDSTLDTVSDDVDSVGMVKEGMPRPISAILPAVLARYGVAFNGVAFDGVEIDGVEIDGVAIDAAGRDSVKIEHESTISIASDFASVTKSPVEGFITPLALAVN